jgi:L-ascorbate metabolism protein UlaG (beta-lactamase superfamily)
MLALVAVPGCAGGLAEVDSARFAPPPPNHITFWGHACFFLDAAGVGIATDPVFDRGLWQRRRFIGMPSRAVLEHVDVVLISHAHDDHASPSSLALLPDDTVILCPAPSAEYLAGEGIDARAMRDGETYETGGVRVVAVAMHHPGDHHGGRPRVDGGALGWVIQTPAATIFYSGDTDYCSSFRDVGWRYAPEIAVLNVNGHLLPPDAARAARDLGARVVIPTHWGAYGYWVVGGNRQPRGARELQQLLGDRLHVLQVGESFPVVRAAH